MTMMEKLGTAKPDARSTGAEALHSVTATGVLYRDAGRSEDGHGPDGADDGAARDVTWALPEEVPVALQINSESFTVMMATPADLRDFATGLILAEGIITSPKTIKGVLVMPVENGITIDLAIDQAAIDPARLTKRAIEGRTGCGLCGVADIAGALKPLPRFSTHLTPAPDVILAAAIALPAHQPMNRLNRTVHAAAWVSPEGGVLTVREDVGRHNALDKLIGALATAGTDPSSGFVLMTSRCSFELVQKCAIYGISALVTVSAPTALALNLARSSHMYLAALGHGGVVVFND
ncbi:MAG: formate dehydrogenase accessory sulfurtransferase FdhD [Hyphomicrobium sp.]